MSLACVCIVVMAGGTAFARKVKIQASPRAVEHNNRGAQLLDAGRLQEAEFELKTAIQLSPDYPEPHNNLGILYKRKALFDQALEYFGKAYKLNKKYVAPLAHIGAVYIAKAEYDVAIKYLKKAISKEPTYAYAFFNIGVAYLMKARTTDLVKRKDKFYGKAEESFVTATQLNPNLIEAHLNLGDLYIEIGELEKAEIRIKLALENNPNNPDIYKQLARVQRLRGKKGEATRVSKQGREVERQQKAKDHFNKGFQLMEEGETLAAEGKKKMASVAFRRAAKEFQYALKYIPNYVEAAYGLGVAYQRSGNLKAARKAWERTLKILPTHAGALFNMATLASQEGRSSEALVYYCRFLRASQRAYPQLEAVARQYLRDNKLSCPN
jgi:protein O-GlcNAc transferase